MFLGQRTHVALVKFGKKATFYINGKIAGVLSASNSVKYLNANLNFGRNYRDSNLYYNGDIDHISIFATSLVPSQINFLFQNGSTFSPSAKPTTALPSITSSFTPNKSPSYNPTFRPSSTITNAPSKSPSLNPTFRPSSTVTLAPTSVLGPGFTPTFALIGPNSFNGTRFSNIVFRSLTKLSSYYFSISLWVKFTTSNVILISLGRDPSNYNGEFMFSIDSNRYLRFEDYSYVASYGFRGTSTSTVPLGYYFFW
jgi:hypothetical protein